MPTATPRTGRPHGSPDAARSNLLAKAKSQREPKLPTNALVFLACLDDRQARTITLTLKAALRLKGARGTAKDDDPPSPIVEPNTSIVADLAGLARGTVRHQREKLIKAGLWPWDEGQLKATQGAPSLRAINPGGIARRTQEVRAEKEAELPGIRLCRMANVRAAMRDRHMGR